MTAPCLPGLFVDAPVRRYVPDTSKAAHREAVAEGRVGARGELVLAALLHRQGATSAELAGHGATLERVLMIRRGLSDLRKQGLVCKGPDRRCAVTGRTCNTWRVTSR